MLVLRYFLPPQSGKEPTLGVKSCIFTKPKELEASFEGVTHHPGGGEAFRQVKHTYLRQQVPILARPLASCVTSGKSLPSLKLSALLWNGEIACRVQKGQIRTYVKCAWHTANAQRGWLSTIIIHSPFIEYPHGVQRLRAPHRIYGHGGGLLACTCHDNGHTPLPQLMI